MERTVVDAKNGEKVVIARHPKQPRMEGGESNMAFTRGDNPLPPRTEKPVEPPSKGKSGEPMKKEEQSNENKKRDTLVQAKDKAQITANTAMSAVQVALLKNLLDSGPAGNMYYYWSLGLIIASITLQVISGFAAIYMAVLHSYFNTYKDDFFDECCNTTCPLRFRRKPPIRSSSLDTWINSTPTSEKTRTTQPDSSAPTQPDDLKMPVESDKDSGCCGNYECITLTTSVAAYEYEILDLYDSVQEEVVRADLKAARFDEELKWLSEQVAHLRSEVLRYEASDPANATEDKERLRRIREELQAAQAKKEDLEKQKRMTQRTKTDASVLESYAMNIQQERVWKRVTWWQYFLNVVLYMVFILNAFIAGIGLANSNGAVAAANATVS